MTADVHNGFGGMACSLANELQDEFPKRGCLAFCLLDAQKQVRVR